MTKGHRALWGLTAAAAAAGLFACLLTGRTLAHALTIALAAVYLACALHLTDRALPDRQTPRVRLLSGLIAAAACGMVLAFSLWHFAAEETIFIGDDSLYYYQQLELSGKLADGLSATAAHFCTSLSTDYTCLANLLLAPLFSLTDRTADGFGLTVAVMTWPLVMYQLRRVALRMADRLHLRGGRALLLCAGVCLAALALPLVHRAALWRQVNLMGIPLVILTMALSLGVDPRRKQPLRWTSLLITCAMLALMRRWFLFFLAGWLPLWGAATAFRLIRGKAWKPLLRFTLCCGGCLVLGALLLRPVLARAIAGNYAVTYAYWRKDSGSLAYELRNQGWLAGCGSLMLIAAGYAWGLCQRRSREIRHAAGLTLISGAVILLLFTRIQNMAYHHATLLLPVYVLGLTLLFAMLATLRQRALVAGLMVPLCAAMAFQFGASVTLTQPQRLSPLLSHVSLRPPVRADREDILAVSAFISETCSADAPALILLNSDRYDRLTFVTPAYPDLTLRQKVAMDRTALVSDGFPRMWFSARYILAPTVPQTNHPGGTVEKLTRFLLADEANRFDIVAAFPMDGFDLLVFERREAVTYEEYEELLALFADEHARYPAVYGDRMGFFYGIEAGWITP